jgi:AraC-like DNA-binding protein
VVGREARVSRAELLAKYAGGDGESLIGRVRDTIALRLLDGDIDIDGTAQMLGLSARSLQRMLEQEGTPYRQLVEECRCRRALALLREGCGSVAEVAISLGYQEPGNFIRAFRRWTGMSPNAFRKRPGACALPGGGSSV